MTAEIKAILVHGYGAPPDRGIDGYVPPDANHFGVRVQVLIGDSKSDRADSFSVFVCSLSWVAANADAKAWEPFASNGLHALPESVAVGTGVWFMRTWDRDDFQSALRAVVESSSPAPDWGSAAARIARNIPWEFDYRYDEHVNAHFGEPFPPEH